MYIYLLIRYQCNIALVVLHFVNFDNFLTFPNRKILQVKHNSGLNFKRFQTHVTQTVSVTSKTVQMNENTLLNVSTLRCQSGCLATGSGNQPQCWNHNFNSKTSYSFAGEETWTVSESQCTHSAPLHRLTVDTNHMKQSQRVVCGAIYWQEEEVNIRHVFCASTREENVVEIYDVLTLLTGLFHKSESADLKSKWKLIRTYIYHLNRHH